MSQSTSTPAIASSRIVRSDAMLIFGLAERYQHSNAGMSEQWQRFMPHIGHIDGQIGNVTYGVVRPVDDNGAIEYLTGVQVREFPDRPEKLTRLRIPPQTYAVFEHRDHVSAVNATWQAIWKHALSDAGHQAAGGPAFERYDERFDPRTGLGGLEIWVPIKA